MSETRNLLISIGTSLGRSEVQMAPIIQKLEDEWYDSIDSLRGISDDKWNSLNVPKRLVDEIRSRIGTISGSGPSGEDKMPSLVPIPAVSSQSAEIFSPPDKKIDVWEVEIAPPSSGVLIDHLLESLTAEISVANESTESLVSCLSTLCQMISNILNNPYEGKYRRIRFSNPKFNQSVGRWNSAKLILNEIGFLNDDEDMAVCPIAYLSRLTDMHGLLGSAIESTGLAPRPASPSGAFNPFKSSIVNAGNTFGAGSAELVLEREIEKSKLIENIETKITNFPEPKFVETKPPVVKKSIFSKKKKKQSSSSDEDKDQTLLMSNLRSLMSSNDSKFQSREKKELEKMASRSNFNVCTIRIVFVDNCYLELSVKPNESVANIYSLVSKCLKDESSKDWTLTVSPPLRKLDRNSRQTMMHEGFVPSVTLRMMNDGRQCDRKVLRIC